MCQVLIVLCLQIKRTPPPRTVKDAYVPSFHQVFYAFGLTTVQYSTSTVHCFATGSPGETSIRFALSQSSRFSICAEADDMSLRSTCALAKVCAHGTSARTGLFGSHTLALVSIVPVVHASMKVVWLTA
jgi:hypothetical protein